MPWWVILLIVLAPIVAVLIAQAVVWLVVRKTGGYAPGWQLRCTKCGHTGDAEKAGIVRIGAGSKLILGRCSACGNRLRMLVLEKKPTESA